MNRLTEHFAPTEATRSATAKRLDIDNTPNLAQWATIKVTAHFLEIVRMAIGGYGMIPTSWFRSKELNANAAVGGSKTSDHLDGRAVDFWSPAFGSGADLARKIYFTPWVPFDQLIIYEGSIRIHIGFGDRWRRQVLFAPKSGGHRVVTNINLIEV